MAKNVELMGAVFPDCPAVLLPTHEGPLARFTDVSDSQAVAADVAQGKQFYLADGTKATGTNQGGGGGGGGGTIKPNARLVLIDYDGSIVDSFTQSEVDALSALPANPDHSGDEIPLTSQGWNWTLTEIREQLTAMPEQTVYVGQLYMPTDQKTHIVIEIPEDAPTNRRNMTLRWYQSAYNGVEVDWGDGSTPETYRVASADDHSHTYANPGIYDISMKVLNGTMYFTGTSGTSGYGIYGRRSNTTNYLGTRIRDIRIGDCKYASTFQQYAIAYCYGLETITIPAETTYAATYAFFNCYALETFAIKGTFGAYALQGCSNLKYVSFKATATSIPDYSLRYCYGLLGVTIPRTVTTIGASALSGLYAIKSITLPPELTTINTEAFANDYALTEMTIPASVTNVQGYLFRNCNALKKVTFKGNVTALGMYLFENCYALESVNIPQTVTTIGNYCFSGCRSLRKIALPDGITNMGQRTFQNAENLTEINLPESLTDVQTYTFSGCNKLTSVTIPASVTSIGSQAYQNCYGVGAYHLKPTTPPTLAGAFTGIASDCVIYVPYSDDHSILAAYQAASNWSTYASRMVEEAE